MTTSSSSGKTQNPSLWTEALADAHAPSLAADIEVDVAVVGGGITGVTAAMLLAQAGKRVALLEMDRTGRGTTSSTTAHLTEAIDARYQNLEKDFGKEGAKLVAVASRVALRELQHLVAFHHIDCDWRRLPGFLYSESERDLDLLHREYEAAKRTGLEVEMTRDVPLPFRAAAAVMFPNQAEFHVGKYLNALVRRLRALHVPIFEGTRVTA
ncbi:MAG TPA: FAD-dependent oxidoreductase, partial [Polyangiaceae bacterium]